MASENIPFEHTDNVAQEREIVEAPRRRSRRRSIIIFAVVSVINAGLLALLWVQLLTPAQSQSQSQQQANFFSGPLVGKQAPNFSLPLLTQQNGPKVSLSDFKGKPVVLNVWQSSCGPCVDEASTFEAAWQRAQGQGIVFIGIDWLDTQADALNFVRTHGITYTNVVDANGAASINYGVTGTPETIFIDRSGKIVGRHAGELTAQTLQQGLQLLTR